MIDTQPRPTQTIWAAGCDRRAESLPSGLAGQGFSSIAFSGEKIELKQQFRPSENRFCGAEWPWRIKFYNETVLSERNTLLLYKQ